MSDFNVQAEALTFDDVLLIPAYSDIFPKEVILKTRLTNELFLNIPFISAAMDTVTESKLAIALAQEGGIGIIHRNMSIYSQSEEVKKVKKFESGIVRNPIVVNSDITVKKLLEVMDKYNVSGFPVIENGKLVGIVTSRDIRFETNLSLLVQNVMTPKERLVTVNENDSREKIIGLLHKNRIEKLLVVNNSFDLCGLITVKDIQNAKRNPFSCKDNSGQLCVGAAIGVNLKDTEERVCSLVDSGADVLVIDTAHGHTKRVVNIIRWIKKNFSVQVVGGNIVTPEAAVTLVKAGVDAVKVGIGPGSICTTRIITGVGMPQITAILNIFKKLKGEVPIIADGGIRYSGDICKALAAGADSVMLGGIFAGTEESAGNTEFYRGRAYKSYRGMGSLSVMSGIMGCSDRYFLDDEKNLDDIVPEGIEGRVPYKGMLHSVVRQLIGGLKSCMGYLGCINIKMLHKKSKFVKITNSGMRESHVHDVNIVKQAPNYQID
ncbi:IMP dehydrogenase [Candidatus Legionella polyplacis]|uniref:Inosine-5'-monophosphate dehydrogenase n=1 Tax=Candidatus Legionella polyplacis TaxID=2005262 RepID=A0ABZ2GYQ1_9GAMM|nr:IMP dehydrogenase [Candidatus Legionella polyplacis]ATW01994.1 IMP dehydrogenase [Candidatus Legionella polyplacis]